MKRLMLTTAFMALGTMASAQATDYQAQIQAELEARGFTVTQSRSFLGRTRVDATLAGSDVQFVFRNSTQELLDFEVADTDIEDLNPDEVPPELAVLLEELETYYDLPGFDDDLDEEEDLDDLDEDEGDDEADDADAELDDETEDADDAETDDEADDADDDADTDDAGDDADEGTDADDDAGDDVDEENEDDEGEDDADEDDEEDDADDDEEDDDSDA